MTGTVTRNFRVHNAQQFTEQFSEAVPSRVYLFIGRVTPWTDDLNPPTPLDMVGLAEYDIWNSMLSAKKITSSDVSFAATRNDWTTGTIYDQFTANTELTTSKKFYIMTDTYNVYKCLDNNNNAQSTVKPTTIANTSFITSDGYRWKFMYTVSAAQALKFLTSLYLPTQTLTANDASAQWNVQQSAANGAVETISVQRGGSLYYQTSGNPQAANSTTITLASAANSTTGKYVNSGVYILSGYGAGQYRKITNYTGGSRLAKVNTAWANTPQVSSTYLVSPYLSITGDGSGLIAYANVISGAVKKVNTVNRGLNYSYANTYVTQNGASGAITVAHLAPHFGHGKDAVAEIYAHNVIMNSKLTGSESGQFMTTNDYRILGLVVDPLTIAGATANSSLYDQTTRLTLTSPSGTFAKDETITGGTSTATASVVEYSNSTVLSVVGNKRAFLATEIITGGTSSATGTVSSINTPDLRKFSGRVLYYEYRQPVTRSSSQTEDVKLILKF
jgi:hypothetical protein